MSDGPLATSMDDLSTFLVVSRARSFRAAARQLGSSASTISDTISRLETRLGIRLFARTTRDVRLTEDGHRLADRIEPLLSEMRAAVAEVAGSGTTMKGSLRLTVPSSVMVTLLPPLIDRYAARYPDVRVEVQVDDRLPDAVSAGCDAGIRYDDRLARDVTAVPIGPRRQRAAVGAAPCFLDRHGTPTHPQELTAHRCLRTRLSDGTLTPWKFARGEERLVIDPDARLVVDKTASNALIRHARGGSGFVYMFEDWLGPHFDEGGLVPVLREWWPEFDGPRLYFHARRFTSAPLRAFVSMLRDERARPSRQATQSGRELGVPFAGE